MIDLIKIPLLVLKKCIKVLNESKLTEVAHIVSLNKQDMVKAFAYQVEHVSQENLAEVPEYVIELYNYIFADEQKERKVINLKYMPKMSEFGHQEGTQAYIIDEMLVGGGHSIEEIAVAINSTKRRVRNHMHSVHVKFNKKFVQMNGKYYMKDNNGKEKGTGKMPRGLFN